MYVARPPLDPLQSRLRRFESENISHGVKTPCTFVVDTRSTGFSQLDVARVFSFHIIGLGSPWRLAHDTSPVCRRDRSIVASILLPVSEQQPFEIVALESSGMKSSCSAASLMRSQTSATTPLSELWSALGNVNRLGACASRRKLALRSTPLMDGRNFLSSWPEPFA